VKDSIQRWTPYVAAAILASLTIRVFFELQDYGPESALRRANEAIQNDDGKGLLNVIVDHKLEGANEKAMVATLRFWYTHGVTMQVGRLIRNGNQVRAALVFGFPPRTFGFPKGTYWSSVWVVERNGRSWFVDANKTATIFWDSGPPG